MIEDLVVGEARVKHDWFLNAVPSPVAWRRQSDQETFSEIIEMKNPLLVVGLMLTACVAVVGTIIVLGNQAPDNLLDTSKVLNVPATFPDQDSQHEVNKTPVDLPVASKTGPWPKIAVAEATYAFGRMAVNAKNQHMFVIRNEGEADLILQEGKPTCKCTTFSVESRVLKPGEETKLVIDWKAGPAPDRAFRHGGPVYTNDPKKAEVNFAVEGAIEAPVELLPNLWSVGSIDLDKTGTFRAAIASHLTDQLEVESVESPSGKVTVRVSPMSVAEIAAEKWANGFRLDVEIAADIPAGKFEEDVKINIKGVDQVPFVTAKLTARKYGNFILQPLDGALFFPDKMALQLGQFPASEGRHVKLLLIVNEKDLTEPFRITDIKADPPFLKASIEPLGVPTGSVHRYALEISVPPGRAQVQRIASKTGHITIHTNHPSRESIQTSVLMHSH